MKITKELFRLWSPSLSVWRNRLKRFMGGKEQSKLPERMRVVLISPRSSTVHVSTHSFLNRDDSSFKYILTDVSPLRAHALFATRQSVDYAPCPIETCNTSQYVQVCLLDSCHTRAGWLSWSVCTHDLTLSVCGRGAGQSAQTSQRGRWQRCTTGHNQS